VTRPDPDGRTADLADARAPRGAAGTGPPTHETPPADGSFPGHPAAALASQQLVLECAHDGTILRAYAAARRVIGGDPPALAGRSLLSLVHPDDRDAARLHWGQALAGDTVTFECRCRGDGGADRWLLWRAASDGLETIYASAVDITDRKRFEQELWETHAETERLVASIASILVRVDGAGRITRWNAAAAAAFGADGASAIGRGLLDVVAWADGRLADAFRQTPAAPVRLAELRVTDVGRTDRFVTLTLTPLAPARGGHEGFLILGTDVTEHRVLEEQLRQAQKLEAIGQLAAGIAHEINTPTQYVGDNARFLRDGFRGLDGLFDVVDRLCAGAGRGEAPDTALVGALAAEAGRADLTFLRHEIPLAIGQALEGIERVTRIVRAMKEFSHPNATKVPVDLNRAVETTLIVAQNEIKYVADAQVELDPGLPPVPCVPGDVNQVILNLLVNAAHAIGDAVAASPGARGRITVTTRRSGPWAEIAVADTGTGIPDAIRDRIFEPFFTTKEVGRGTGQGLAIAHAVVVTKHKGQIRVDSTPGQGSTFVVRLPIAPAADA
jgi:PAS domain S-box-containing protein